MDEETIQTLANLPAKSQAFLGALRRASRRELLEAAKLRAGVPGERRERRAIALRLTRLEKKSR